VNSSRNGRPAAAKFCREEQPNWKVLFSRVSFTCVPALSAGIFVVQPHKLEEFVVPDLEGCDVSSRSPTQTVYLQLIFICIAI